MRFALLFLFAITCGITANSQTSKEVDSINAIIVQGARISSDSLIRVFEKNSIVATKMNYQKGIADAWMKISIVYYYNGDYEQNVQATLKAIKIYETAGFLGQTANAYAEMGYQMKRRDFKKALYYMQKGKHIAETHELEDDLKNIYNNYGVLKEINNELDSALFYYRRGLVIKQKTQDAFGIPYSISNIAGIYLLKKDFANARLRANESLQQRIVLKDSIGAAENITQLAEIDMAEHNYDAAIKKFKTSSSIALKKEYRYLVQQNYKRIADAFKNVNKADSALYYFEKFSAYKDSITNLAVQEKVTTLSIEFETEKKENQILTQRAQLAEKELEVKQKNNLIFGTVAFAAVLGILGYLFYHQQRLKNRQLFREGELKEALAKIETQNRLQEQRLRISRDLHDNIGAQLTFIISSLDNLKYGFSDMGDKLKTKLSGISGFTSQTIYELRDTIWAMNKEDISFEDLQVRISNFMKNAKDASEKTQFIFLMDKGLDMSHSFTSVEGMNLYRIIQESVNNALKYADATNISVIFSEENEELLLQIIDDGVGFNTAEIERGNGLNSINKRARDIGANATLWSKVGSGTTISIRV